MQCTRLFVLLAGGALAAHALGQPAPKLISISPDWIQRGTTIEVVFTGDNLGEVSGFLFDGDAGLSATNVPLPALPQPTITVESVGGGISRAEPAPVRDSKRLVAKVTATADASLAAREVRVVSAGGVSNPLLLNVGQWPEVAKRDPNGTLADAQPVTLPAVISGLLNTLAQTNHFRFKAARGEELVFEIDAARRGSPLDSSLAVLDASGKELARNEDALGLDSLLFFTAPADGEYVLQLRDYRFRGGNDYRYRLTAGPVPYVESIFPFGGQRGKSVEIALTGRNLEGTTKMTLNVDAKAPRGRQEIRVSTPRGYSNLVPFDVQDFPDLAEAEPNDAPDKANSVAAPVVINGRIGKAGDADYFKFKPDKDQKIVCSVAAGQFGSALDALLTLSDASGKVILQNDDSAGADARLEFDARKDTEYVLALRDLTERGGGDFAYRLSIRPPSGAVEAGFTVAYLPDAVRVHRGGRMKVRCEVTRQAGFDGPVRCEFDDLPPGVYAEPLIVPAGQTSGLMTLAAVEDCALGSHPLQLRASVMAGGKEIVRPAQPLNGDAPVRRGYVTVLEAAPYTLELASLSAAAEQNQSVQIEALVRRVGGFAGDIKLVAEGFAAGREPISKNFSGGEATLKGTETAARLTLTPRTDSEVGTRAVVVRGEAAFQGRSFVQYTRPLPVTVSQIPLLVSSTLSRLTVTALPAGSDSAAGEAETKIKVERRAGFSGDVDLALEGAPAGVKTVLDRIPAGATETTLKITASEKTPAGTNTLVVIASGQHGDRNFKFRSGAITLIVNAPEEEARPSLAATNAPGAAVVPARQP